ncbi:fimbrial chaperone protein, partial [Escherichia coli]|nr:fimbrial chaperone protein [Escherichia coli]
QNGHDVKLSEETKNKIAAFAPFEKVSLGSKLSGKDISIVSFDDYGVDREYKL